MPEPRDIRLVYIAPLAGESGVGDYADDFVDAVRPHLGEVVEYRHSGPGKESLRSLWIHRREIRRVVRQSPGNTVVHAEHSGGAMLPFWGTVGLGSVRVSATVHDPPLSVWWPFRIKLAARFRLVSHGIHYPTRALTRRLEAWVNRGRTLITLSRLGAQELRKVMTRSTVLASFLLVPERPPLDAVTDRPLAIGLFGYVYRGKGFEVVKELRRALDPSIVIRIAGRGTEKLDPIEGVEVLGEVEGAAEDAFFNSIRVLLVPYDARHVYGQEAYPAASTVSRAMAYGTPVLCRAHGALSELADDGGAVLVEGGPVELAEAANALLTDTARLGRLAAEVARVQQDRSAARIAQTFLGVWSAP